MAIKLSNEDRQAAVASIRRFFAETLEEEIGELKANQILHHCLTEIGPSVYNRAIADAQRFFLEKAEDLPGSCFEPEFPYWNEKKRASRGEKASGERR
jgi:uncharacterized protein (DUF2164 family)